MSKKFTIQSLGCAKNLCDAEQMLARLFEAGWEFTDDPDEADVAIINTCAFIEDAKRESIDAILETAKSRDSGALTAVVVTGCMAERYREEVLETMPEVDAILGTASYMDIVEVCDRLLLRPLIGMDKEEIIRVARATDTFEISTRPFEDCCTVFTPKHPNTKPKSDRLAAEEAKLDFEPLLRAALDGAELIVVGSSPRGEAEGRDRA